MASDLIPIPWGNGYLQATPDEFAAILARGVTAGPSAAPVAPPAAAEGLLTSAQLGERLALTSAFCEAQAASGAWPSHRVGRYLRFSLPEVLSAIATKGTGAKP